MGGQLDGIDDDILDIIDQEEEDNKVTMTPFTFTNTNARSLCPKIESFITCFGEMDTSLAVVTETWLADGCSLDSDVADLVDGTGIQLIHRNRRTNVRGVAHGGVAIAYRRAVCKMSKICLLYTSPSPRDGLLSRMPSSA